VGQSPASEDVNTEAKEATALEAVTRQQLVKLATPPLFTQLLLT
jgi:hypothetical protein